MSELGQLCHFPLFDIFSQMAKIGQIIWLICEKWVLFADEMAISWVDISQKKIFGVSFKSFAKKCMVSILLKISEKSDVVYA